MPALVRSAEQLGKKPEPVARVGLPGLGDALAKALVVEQDHLLESIQHSVEQYLEGKVALDMEGVKELVSAQLGAVKDEILAAIQEDISNRIEGVQKLLSEDDGDKTILAALDDRIGDVVQALSLIKSAIPKQQSDRPRKWVMDVKRVNGLITTATFTAGG